LLDNGWFAANGHPYTKRYSDLCALLDIQVYQQLSRVQQQLDPSNDELLREKFVASYDYPVDPSGRWTGTMRWWPGPKWIYDQEQRRRPKDRAKEIFLPEEDSSNGQVTEVGAQLFLPISNPVVKTLENEYEERVESFYEQIGQKRPSQEKVNSGIATLRNLVEEQGYSSEELDFALAWIVRNISEKFDGRVKSIGILPHVIGEALGERAVTQKKKKRTGQMHEHNDTSRKLADERKEIEEQLHRMSQQEQDELRRVAVDRLIEQGVPRRFLLDAMVTAEMCRLLQEKMGVG